MMTVDEAIAKAQQWRKEGACGPAGLVAIALLDELESVKAQAEEDAFVIQRLGGILADVCVALKGPDPEMHRYSYHDIAEVAHKIKLELDLFRAQEEGKKSAYENGGIKFFEYDAFKEATRQVQEQSAQLQESFERERTQNK